MVSAVAAVITTADATTAVITADADSLNLSCVPTCWQQDNQSKTGVNTPVFT